MRKKVFIFIVIFLAIWVSVFYPLGRKLRKHHILTQGYVTSVDGGGKGNWGPGVGFYYFIESKKHNTSKRHSELKYGIKYFVGKSFPVVYRYNGLWYDDDILMTPKDFKKYGYTFPDSLKWVLKYIDKNR